MVGYYRVAIWLPIIVPAMLWAGVHAFGMPKSDLLGGVVAMLLLSLLNGGVPYAALAVWATWRARSLDDAGMRRMVWGAPVLMLVPFTLYAVLLSGLRGDFRTELDGFALAALYILPIGYLYVVVVLAFGWLWSQRRNPSSAGAGTL
jgi:hypothetical protein